MVNVECDWLQYLLVSYSNVIQQSLTSIISESVHNDAQMSGFIKMHLIIKYISPCVNESVVFSIVFSIGKTFLKLI